MSAVPTAPVVSARHITYKFGKVTALNDVTLEIPRGVIMGMIGPDGVGKSTLLSLITGARAMQKDGGELEVLGGDMRSKAHRDAVCPKIAYMPQGLGKNLYFTLTVEENLQFFGRLFGHDAAERRRRIDQLTRSTGLHPFLNRAAGKLSGGMKQKLGLCCALIHDPDLLVLDEPTTGVDPLARRQFWDLIDSIRAAQPDMSVMVATAYMDEAQRFQFLVAMDGGKILTTGTPAELLERTGKKDLDAAFIQLLPEERRAGHREVTLPPLDADADDISIEAEGLTKRFGNFTAVDHVSFRIRRGEIFGFLGSNGCGKTTTMRMLTGLLPATEGRAELFGRPISGDTMEVRRNLGYMTQLFSLYNELTVRQNLTLYARLYGIPEPEVKDKVEAMITRFDLKDFTEVLPKSLPLGIKQRLSLAAAVIHSPKILILDEPTSGVDPVARDGFWELIIELSRRDKVTIFITTHFMNEAGRCDRISLMHAGKSLACDTPDNIIAARKTETLEAAFIDCLEEAESAEAAARGDAEIPETEPPEVPKEKTTPGWMRCLTERFSFRRFYSCMWREDLELVRDPIRITLALFGALLLMVVMGYGISMDVEDLTFAVLDRDHSELSTDYALNIAGSRYFIEKRPVETYDEIDRRMKNGELSMVVELPPNFARDVEKGLSPKIAFWVDGSMPSRAETINGYVESMHNKWLSGQNEKRGLGSTSKVDVDVRYLYNPNVESLPSMVPAVIPVLLIMIPAILAALAVVREKEMGSIINLYVTPLTRLEFLLGKQMPYVFFSVLSSLFLVVMAVTLFDVPIKGSIPFLLISLAVYCVVATGFGLLASSVTRSQIAVIFLTMLATVLPATQLCGLINPVESQAGLSRLIGECYPTTYMLLISRGVFNKALGFAELHTQLLVLIAFIPFNVVVGTLLQKKQES
ncbi:MAG: ribosome-associated ATPase/putative transporter RbbA [Lentisphaeria bacterium]|nr:ribosome-associated ATPase/putative transporter RbbA [Lentisphaeria bacterium]